MNKTTTAKRSTMAVAALVMVVLGTASAGWACSKQASAASAGGQTSGPAGTTITVTGRDFDSGPVEVRWDSKSGTVLARASGPSFSVSVTIPQEAPARIHYIVTMQPLAPPTHTFAFEVTAPVNKTSTTDSGTTSEGNTSTSAGAADEEDASGETSTGTNTSNEGTNTSNEGTNTSNDGSTTNSNTGSSKGTNTGTSTGSTGTTDQTTQAGTGTQTAAPATAAPAPATAASAPRPTRSASANPPAVTSPTGQVVFGGSSAAPAEEVAAVSSATMVSGDTWSGFAASTKPSLLSEPIGAPSSSDSGNGPALAMGLLAAGMMAMFAGFGVAEVSRKRAVAVAKKN